MKFNECNPTPMEQDEAQIYSANNRGFNMHDGNEAKTICDDGLTCSSSLEQASRTIVNENKGVKKRLKTSERVELEQKVKELFSVGHPSLAIALKLDVSVDTVNKIFTKIMQGSDREKISIQQYQVVKSGVKIKDLENTDLSQYKYLKITPHKDGVIIQPFKEID